MGNKKINSLICQISLFLIYLIIFLLFFENFIYATSFGELTFREIDDLAFQSSLRKIHQNLDSGNFDRLLKANDYGYGWIYWFSLSLVSYPLYLLHKYQSISWPLIVAPRQISLLFSCLTLIYLKKIFDFLKYEKITTAISLLCFSLLPSFGYFSLRFGTVAPIMFFSTLSLFYSFKMYRDKTANASKPLIALSIASSIKLSGLLIAPLTFFLLSINSLESKNYKVICKNFLLLFLLTLLFTIPWAYLLPFTYFISDNFYIYYQALINYFLMLKHFIDVTNISQVSDTPYKDFIFGLFHNYYLFLAFCFLFFGLVLFAFENFVKKYALIFLALALIPFLYLFLFVKNFISAGVYFTSFSFIFFLGLQFLRTTKQKICLIPFLIIFLYSFFKYDLIRPNSEFTHFSYFKKYIADKNDIKKSSKINNCLNFAINDTSSISIATDYQIRSNLNQLQFPSYCILYIFSNLSDSSLNFCGKPFEYLIIDTSSPALLGDTDFKKYLGTQSPTIQKSLEEDHYLKTQLYRHGKIHYNDYKLMCSFDNVNIYKLKAFPDR